MKRLSLLLFLFNAFAGMAQDRIHIERADELVYDRDFGRFQRCIGHVRFRQDQVFMDCDSAWFYEEVNKIEAFGNIHIWQQDSFDLRGGYVEYDGDQRIARVQEEVVLTDDQMRLRTNRLDYDLNGKSAYYVGGGDILNGEDHLESEVGTYYSRSKEFHFHRNVVLTNPEYTMHSDTLQYNTQSHYAYFHGPTYIRSEENTIFCRYGWYNTELNTSQFSQGSYIEGKDNRLEADSMVYDRNSGYGQAFGHIELTDTVERLRIRGDYGAYWRKEKRTLITGSPEAAQDMDGDSFYLRSDTMLDIRDTADRRVLHAFHHIRVYKSDMQAVADSMCYDFSDSMITLYQNPVVWSDSDQLSGDTIIIFQRSEGVDRVEAFPHALVVEHDLNGYFNQIKGRIITTYFADGKLDRIHVDGNAQSLYYVQEDSANYSGVKDVLAGRMQIATDSSHKISTISYEGKPKAVFYPLEDLPVGKDRIEGFHWSAERRPKERDFVGK